MKNKNTELEDVQSLNNQRLSYSLVLHGIREKLELTIPEYILADYIYHLASNPNSPTIGWCFASKDSLAEQTGFSASSIKRYLNRLEKKELIERKRTAGNGLTRATGRWYDEVETIRQRLNVIYKNKTKIIKSRS